MTITLQIEDPNGYFIPNIHPDNFAVYEGGVRQKLVSAEVQHAPVSIVLLLEEDGRYHELNEVLGVEIPQASEALLNVLGHRDRLAVFTYSGQVKMLAGFGENRGDLSDVFEQLGTPEFSEANLYDAILGTLNFMRDVRGRKAIILISSGLDTFSKTTYEQVLQAAEQDRTPIYIIGLSEMMRGQAFIYGSAAPYAHMNWNEAERRLEHLATASGGRICPDQTLNFPPCMATS